MSEVVRLERHGDIAAIVVENPPVNALGQAVRQGLTEKLAEAVGDDAIHAILVLGAGRTFIAGADIREFGKPPQPPSLPDVIDAMDACPKLLIAALHGTALGGGFEVALGCHYRVALPGTRVGLPEVKLGILPGAGGTQRTPRLIGAEKALDMILSGDFIAADKALELGLIDEIGKSGTPLEAGLAFARKAVDEAYPIRRVRDLEDKILADRGNSEVFDKARAKLEKTARGLFSPFRCVDAVQAAVELPFDEGLKREREMFHECLDSPQRAGLIHAFFIEREVGKVPGLKDAAARPLESAGVIGGGTMGAGIAVSMLLAGLPVTMIERDEESLARGRATVDQILDASVKRGKLTADDKADIMTARFSGAVDYAALARADIVVEAVFEDMEVKRKVFANLEAVMKPGAILATNTSYLDINALAAGTSRPADVIGLHFFSPAHVMKLLEIVVAEQTAPEVVASGFALAKKLGKIGVRAGVCDGFIGNRMLATYRKQTDYMVEDGASPYEVDAAIRALGFPMGPFQVSDLAGVDIGWMTRRRLDATRDPRERYVGIADRLYEQGRLGQKSGAGWYRYAEGDRKGAPDPVVEAIVAEERRKKGIQSKAFSQEQIQRRYLAAMINEAAKILEEGIALRPLDIDVTLLYGYGFPRWRGGPMKYADTVGLDRILADIRGYAKEDAFAWQPAQLLVDLVERGESFESLN
jgi:3-hydroxyacyl-CoA dehydrogenase